MDELDKLRELFRMQDALNQRIGVHPAGMTEADKAQWIVNDSKHI